MAKTTKPTNHLIQSSTEHGKEASRSSKADAERRLNDQQKILNAADLSGEYDHIRELFTTFRSGKVRPITNEDLQHFRSRTNDIKKAYSGKGRFRGGIRIASVIDLSASIDRERARKEIHTAIPVSNKGGVIHFSTNASRKSESVRHHVYVELLDFASWAVSPEKPNVLVKKMIKSTPIKYDCDCGRHTFWYRYIASIGGFAYTGDGHRAEDGYPKIKNPNLYGVACKHVLRVMALFQSPSMQNYLIKMMEKNREQLQTRQKGNSPKEQEAFLQALKKESSSTKSIALSSKARREQLLAGKTPEHKVIQKALEKSKANLSKNVVKNGREKAIQAELKKIRKNLTSMKKYSKEQIDMHISMQEELMRQDN